MEQKQSSRVLVNLLGLPLLLLIIYLGDSFNDFPIFSIFVLIVLLLGAVEIKNLTSIYNSAPLTNLLCLFLILLQINRYQSFSSNLNIHHLILLATIIVMIVEIFRRQKNSFMNIAVFVFAFIWLGLMLGSLAELRNIPSIGFKITLTLFLSVWICDTAAFYFGKKFGDKKIIPLVSPNKTWVGSIAGLASSILFIYILKYYNFFNDMIMMHDALIIGLITGGIAQLGDWSESLLKRNAGIKDTSSILQGHGGILDRFDSLSFAAPLTLIYVKHFIAIGS
tara:strand:- start:570 stop:1409 length:840 start_codon:yes stop_codon:yes gene_type:complete